MADREPIPPLSLILGYGPMLPIALGAAVGWLGPVAWQPGAVSAAWLWATAILLFLAGVTRGLSFFSPGGPRPMQIGQMIWLYLLGLGALVSQLWIAFVLLPLGFASIALFDPPAARLGLAPAHFARLRPPQMGIAVASLIALLLRVTMVR